MRIISSRLALLALLALDHDNELGLTELARVLQVKPSSAQRALRVLQDDGLVQARQSRYALAENDVARHLAQLAVLSVPAQEALRIIARAHPSVELLALAPPELMVVFAPGGDPLRESRAAQAIETISQRAGLTPRYHYHDDVRQEATVDPNVRRRVLTMDVLHGDLDRTVPDRSRHREGPGSLLGHAHPALRLPSRRAIGRLKRRFGLATLALFGSAVRSDFRPDSDVDVVVSFTPGADQRADTLLDLEHELEHEFGRDVDVVPDAGLPAYLRRRVTLEAVPL